ncbi:MAG TPA: CNNM domain-containing protein [Rhizomicrobium sp.]|nr:CNNM domain-containing protein [Rhizomicrobium sp.]
MPSLADALPVILLLSVSALLSAAETAFCAVSRGRMHQLEQDGSAAARRVNRLLADRERMSGALLLANIILLLLATALLLGRMQDTALALGLMAAAVLVFVVALPRMLAQARTDAIALALALPAQGIVSLFAPLIAAAQYPVRALLAPNGPRPEEEEMRAEDAAHEEIRGAVALHTREGNVERGHRDMIGGILDLRDLKVGDVMVHRRQMTAIDVERPASEIVAVVTESEHTRIPLWRNEPDNIVGILNAKHLAQALVEHRGKLDAIDVESLLTPPWFVPDTTTLEEQLEAFREKRSRLAMVVDEYGTLQGLVTVEDILAEIFGEIPDEHHRTSRPDVRRRPDGSYLVDGTVPVRELNREYEWSLPDEGATTIAGLVIQETGTIPEPGQRFAFFGFRFEILRRQRNQITALKVVPPEKTEVIS